MIKRIGKVLYGAWYWSILIYGTICFVVLVWCLIQNGFGWIGQP